MKSNEDTDRVTGPRSRDMPELPQPAAHTPAEIIAGGLPHELSAEIEVNYRDVRSRAAVPSQYAPHLLYAAVAVMALAAMGVGTIAILKLVGPLLPPAAIAPICIMYIAVLGLLAALAITRLRS